MQDLQLRWGHLALDQLVLDRRLLGWEQKQNWSLMKTYSKMANDLRFD